MKPNVFDSDEAALRDYRQSVREALSDSTGTVNDEPSKTIAGPAAEADINVIAKQFGLSPTSKLPLPPEAMDPRYYGDLSDVDVDLHTAMGRVFEAQEHFERLPAAVRSRFNHSPGQLWDFLQDDANRQEAIDLGILVAPPPPPPPAPPAPAAPVT